MSGSEHLTEADIRELGLRESIFPIFPVNVPMPSDTAVPGSYWKRKPADPKSNEEV